MQIEQIIEQINTLITSEKTIIYINLIIYLIGIGTIIKWICKGIKKWYKSLFIPKQNKQYKKQKAIAEKNKLNSLNQIINNCKKSIPEQKHDYIPNSQVLYNFQNNPYNTTAVNEIAQDILSHIGYNGNMPNVKYTLLGNDLSNHYFDRVVPIININSEPKRHPNVLLALIIRECVHLYLFEKQIKYIPSYMQEESADVYAIKLGFYNYLIKGYNQIGYTNTNDLNHIKKNIA